jgi:protein-S-isoprenylcysteine O-methyltransferase Ste14
MGGRQVLDTVSGVRPTPRRDGTAAAVRGMLTTALGTCAFALVHSAFASDAAKRRSERMLGTRRRNALYRPFFLAQSAVTLGALAAVCARAPSRTLYHVRGPAAAGFHALQALGLVWAVWGAHRVGLARITGVAGLRAWLRRSNQIPREPEAQGPALGADGRLDTRGPFAVSRHPLNLAPLAVFWLVPRMTTRWLAFCATSTAYLVLGSRHEEARLRTAYGERYERYRREVPFYVPRRLPGRAQEENQNRLRRATSP